MKKDPFIIDIFYFITASILFFNTRLYDLDLVYIIPIVLVESLLIKTLLSKIIKEIFTNFANNKLKDILEEKIKTDKDLEVIIKEQLKW